MTSIFIYPLIELKKRKKTYAVLFVILTITMSVMLNFFSLLNGTIKYSAEKSQDYHIVLAYLSDDDIETVKQIPYVENVRIEYINDIRHIYVKLKDADPSAYINKCYEILDKIDAWNKYDYYRGYTDMRSHGAVIYGWINNAYAIALSFSTIFSNIFLIVVFNLILFITYILFYENVTYKYADEYGILRSCGMTSAQMALSDQVKTCIIYIISLIASSVVSLLIMPLFCLLSEKFISVDGFRISYAYPVSETLLISCGFFILTTVFHVLRNRRKYKEPVIDEINKIKTFTLPFVKASSKKYTVCDDISLYGVLYQIRSRHTVIRQSLSGIMIIITPNLLLYFSSFMRNTVSYYDIDARGDIMISSSGTGITNTYITDGYIDEIAGLGHIEKIEVSDSAETHDGHEHVNDKAVHTRICIYVEDGCEDEIIPLIIRSADELKLQTTDNYHGRINQENTNNFYLILFMSQAALALIFDIFTVRLLYRNYLESRIDEFMILRSLGITAYDMKKTLSWDYLSILISLCTGYAAGFVIFKYAMSAYGLAKIDFTVLISSAVILIVMYILNISAQYSKSLSKIMLKPIAEGDFR